MTLKKAFPLMMLGLCASFLFYKYILQVYPSVITTQLRATYQLSGAGLGNLAATFYYAYMIMQLFAGPLIDKWGVRLTGTLSFGLSALGLVIFSMSPSIGLANISRALMGVGVAFSTIVYMKTGADWFAPKRYPLISGLLASAAMAGAVFGTAPLAYCMIFYPWQKVLFALGIVGLILTTFFGYFVQQKSVEGIVAQEGLSRQLIMKVLTDKRNWMLTFYSGLAFSPLAIMAGLWGNPFLQATYQLNASDAGSFISLSFVGLGIGSPLIGMLANRIRPLTLLFIGTGLSFVCLSLVIYYPHLSFPSLALLLFAFGFFLGAFMLAFTLGKEINPIAVTATVIAMINASDAFIDAFTEPAIGKFLDWHAKHLGVPHAVVSFSPHDYRIALSVLPLYLILALLSLLGFHCLQKKGNAYV